MTMEVTLLTKDDCAFCDQAKEILERLCLDLPIQIVTIDLHSSEGEELAQRGGILFPPGIFIQGEAVAYGRPSERGLRKEIEQRLTRPTLDTRPTHR